MTPEKWAEKLGASHDDGSKFHVAKLIRQAMEQSWAEGYYSEDGTKNPYTHQEGVK